MSKGSNDMKPNRSCPGSFKPSGKNKPKGSAARMTRRRKPLG